MRRLEAAAIDDVFVVGGDGARPLGGFGDAESLLRAMHLLAGRGWARLPSRLGIAAYPEGHPLVDDRQLHTALHAKRALATYVVTQMCFDPETITSYVAGLRRDGIRLPVYAGVPGRVDRRRLVRIAGRIGVGDSARFLRKHRLTLLRVLLPRAFDPGRLVRGLSEGLARPEIGLTGLHLYTLGGVATTETWRRRLAERLDGGRR
jgi:methylenetetrahydrofolate reductase (NADPH)